MAAAVLAAASLAACAESPEARQEREQAAMAEASALVASGKYVEATEKLSKLPDTAEISALRKRAADGRERQEAERRAKEFGDTAATLKNELEALRSSDIDSNTDLTKTLETFDRAQVFLIANPSSSLDESGNKLRSAIKSTLARKQATLFPVLRATYGKSLAQSLWENDVEVITTGGGNRRIRFIAGMFAANRNIAAAQEAAAPMLQKLRFSRSQYEWYKGSEFSYYDMEPEPDGKVPD